ncbi:hypothetical protein E2562_001512 [Oryza meyeriana var. granulata]|uniref:Uncharacterized protein n=1 Tax=Oryza meyeriana var. granulata TaxID=110450 RepID=A0A6G1DDM6_9ORYZ|nr:hypothetical protein E2562_001512 [Oryza meyeriana var. granulata]
MRARGRARVAVFDFSPTDGYVFLHVARGGKELSLSLRFYETASPVARCMRAGGRGKARRGREWWCAGASSSPPPPPLARQIAVPFDSAYKWPAY